MPLTVSKKEWEAKRPKSAKDSGVGKGVDAVLSSEKSLGSIGVGEKARTAIDNCTKAIENIEALRNALTVGETKAKGGFSSKEDERKFEAMLDSWRNNLKTFEREVREKAKDAAIRVAEYDGDQEGTRLAQLVTAVRVHVRTLDGKVAKSREGVAPLREEFQKLTVLFNACVQRVGDKHTTAGMEKYLAKALIGALKAGYIGTSDLPDPEGRGLLVAQLQELRREFAELGQKFA